MIRSFACILIFALIIPIAVERNSDQIPEPTTPTVALPFMPTETPTQIGAPTQTATNTKTPLPTSTQKPYPGPGETVLPYPGPSLGPNNSGVVDFSAHSAPVSLAMGGVIFGLCFMASMAPWIGRKKIR